MTKAKITWKTWEEIEEEKNAPKPPTTEDRIRELENLVVQLSLERGD